MGARPLIGLIMGQNPIRFGVWEEPLAKLVMGEPPAKLGLGVWE